MFWHALTIPTRAESCPSTGAECSPSTGAALCPLNRQVSRNNQVISTSWLTSNYKSSFLKLSQSRECTFWCPKIWRHPNLRSKGKGNMSKWRDAGIVAGSVPSTKCAVYIYIYRLYIDMLWWVPLRYIFFDLEGLCNSQLNIYNTHNFK